MMENKNRVIIIYDSIPEFRTYFESAGIKIYPAFKEVRGAGLRFKVLSILKRVCIKFNIFLKFWYSDWVRNIGSSETIICFMTKHYKHIEYIKSRHPLKRTILWYWNPVFRVANPLIFMNNGYELWSFDKVDCDRYNMRFNTTFYFKDLKLNCKQKKYDVIFLGYSKNREAQLTNLENILRNEGLVTYFHVVPLTNKSNSSFERMAYYDYLQLVAESSAIVDLVQEGQDGLTLRPMEALFFRKKLITNSSSIINERFYNRENIFLLGSDDLRTIKSFITMPYREANSEDLNYYDVRSWLERFFQESADI